jgi:protein LSM14
MNLLDNMTNIPNFTINPNYNTSPNPIPIPNPNLNTDRPKEKVNPGKDVNTNENTKNKNEELNVDIQTEKNKTQPPEKGQTEGNQNIKKERTKLNNENQRKNFTEKNIQTQEEQESNFKYKDFGRRNQRTENDDNNGGENRRYDNRRYQTGNRGRGNKNYRGGNNYVQKDRRTGKFQQDSEFDLFESTKLFQKDLEMAKIEEQVKEMKIEGGNTTNEEPETAYDPEKSIYDTLSCETFERMNNKKINRREKNKLQEEQQRVDHETFGYVPYDRNDRNDRNDNYNYSKKRYYSNNQNQRPKNTRNQYTGTRPGQKHQTTVRKFRPVNKDKTENNV